MKKITFLSLLLTSFMMFGQTTLWDFEDPGVLPQFQFGNLGFGNVANPDPVGNPSARCLEINKPDSADWFGGFGFETPGVIIFWIRSHCMILGLWLTEVIFYFQPPIPSNHFLIQTH